MPAWGGFGLLKWERRWLGEMMRVHVRGRDWLGAGRIFGVALLVVATAGCFCSGAGAQGVDEVVAKNIQARGGLEKLKGVRSIRTTAKLTQGSFRAEFRQEGKRGGKVREEFIIQGLAQIQAYDGKTGWQISPFGGRKDPELLSQDDLKSLVVDADIDGPLIEYKEKGNTAEMVGHDSMEGTDCFKIKLNMKNGDVRYYYLDADSYLDLKVEIQTTIRGALQESELYYGDYEEVNGIFYPFTVEQAQKGSASRTQISVVKIEQNVSLDDSLFSMPASKPQAKAPAAAN